MSYISTSGNCTYHALHFMCQRTKICCMSTDLSDRHVSTALSSICQPTLHGMLWQHSTLHMSAQLSNCQVCTALRMPFLHYNCKSQWSAGNLALHWCCRFKTIGATPAGSCCCRIGLRALWLGRAPIDELCP